MYYIKNILIALLFLQLTINEAFSKQGNFKIEDLTIVVSSSDGYSELWDPFFKQLFKNWESLNAHNSHVKIILVSNTKQYSNKRVLSSLSHAEKGWSGNMREALNQVKTNYILYLQEDYFIYSRVNEKRIQEILYSMRANGIAYTELYIEKSAANLPSNPKLEDSVIKPKEADYRNSLQASIWEKKVFDWLLYKDESPWQFEIIGNERSKGVIQEFWGLSSNPPIQYINVVEKGFVTTASLDLLKQFNIDYTPSLLPLSSEHKFMYYLATKKPKQYRQIRKLQQKFNF